MTSLDSALVGELSIKKAESYNSVIKILSVNWKSEYQASQVYKWLKPVVRKMVQFLNGIWIPD